MGQMGTCTRTESLSGASTAPHVKSSLLIVQKQECLTEVKLWSFSSHLEVIWCMVWGNYYVLFAKLTFRFTQIQWYWFWNTEMCLYFWNIEWALKTVSHLMTLCSSGSRHGQVWHLPHRPQGQRPGGMQHSPTVPGVLSRARHRPPSRWCQWLRLWGSKPCRKCMVAPRAPLC